MTREIALHCMKSYSEHHSDLCELCPIYGQTGDDHCFEDALEYVIKDLEQEPILDKLNKMKSEIADSLEFWDYSPSNNPLARDILETITNFWGDMRGEEE